MTTFPTTKLKHPRITDESNELPREWLETDSFRRHINKRYLSNQWAPEMNAGRDDVKTIGSLWRLSISPEIQPSQLPPPFCTMKR